MLLNCLLYMLDLEYDPSSSDDESLPNTPSLCHASSADNAFVVSAKSTTDYTIKMQQGSFVFKRENANFVLQFNRMFLWRLLNSTHAATNECVDLFRLRDFVTRIRDLVVTIQINNGTILFDFNGQEKQIRYDKKDDLHNAFDQLYYTAMRKHKTDFWIDKLLAISVQLLSVIAQHY
jgi:hypothetical protein